MYFPRIEAFKNQPDSKRGKFFYIAERWDVLWRETQILQASDSQLSLAISAAESISHFVMPPLYCMLNN